MRRLEAGARGGGMSGAAFPIGAALCLLENVRVARARRARRRAAARAAHAQTQTQTPAPAEAIEVHRAAAAAAGGGAVAEATAAAHAASPKAVRFADNEERPAVSTAGPRASTHAAAGANDIDGASANAVVEAVRRLTDDVAMLRSEVASLARKRTVVEALSGAASHSSKGSDADDAVGLLSPMSVLSARSSLNVTLDSEGEEGDSDDAAQNDAAESAHKVRAGRESPRDFAPQPNPNQPKPNPNQTCAPFTPTHSCMAIPHASLTPQMRACRLQTCSSG